MTTSTRPRSLHRIGCIAALLCACAILAPGTGALGKSRDLRSQASTSSLAGTTARLHAAAGDVRLQAPTSSLAGTTGAVTVGKPAPTGDHPKPWTTIALSVLGAMTIAATAGIAVRARLRTRRSHVAA